MCIRSDLVRVCQPLYLEDLECVIYCREQELAVVDNVQILAHHDTIPTFA